MIEILESRSAVTTEELWCLCNEKNWFTGGTNAQYDKLFDLNREGASLDDLALVIWICSPDWTRAEVLEVLNGRFGGVK